MAAQFMMAGTYVRGGMLNLMVARKERDIQEGPRMPQSASRT
jgi:hypothetical protein